MTLPIGCELLVATRNPGKAAELSLLVAAHSYRVVTLDGIGLAPSAAEDALEVHDTFEANARAKAEFYRAASGGRCAVADDSGLQVDALGGAPGIRSRRWAGATGSDAAVARANNDALLAALHGCMNRAARFTCVVALAGDHGLQVFSGEVRGRIAVSPRGEHGFGYDPLFEADDLGGRTFGEATSAEKRTVSHRARAFAALAAALLNQTARAGPDVAPR